MQYSTIISIYILARSMPECVKLQGPRGNTKRSCPTVHIVLDTVSLIQMIKLQQGFVSPIHLTNTTTA